MNYSGSQNITAKIFKRSGLLSLARLLQVAVTFIIFWFYSIKLSPYVYGSYQKIFVLISFFSGIFCLGLPIVIASLPTSATAKYIFAIIKRSKFIYTAIVILGAVFLIKFSGFAWETGAIMLILVTMNAAYLIMEAYLVKISRDQYVLYNNIVYAICYLGLHYIAVGRISSNLPTLLLWLCILSFARLVLLFLSNFNVISINNKITVDPATYHQYFIQWKFLSVNEALDIFSRQIDKLFLLWLLTAEMFAVYFNGSYEIPLIGILISTTGTFITMHTVQQQEHIAVKKLLGQSTVVLACILFPLLFFLFFNAGPLFHILFRHVYDDAVPVFMISCWIIPLRIMNYTAILQGYHKGKDILIGSSTGLIVKIIFSIILYSVWGIRGVALAFIIGTLTQIIYYLLKTSTLLHTTILNLLPYKKIISLFLIAGVVAYASSLLLNNLSPLILLTCQALICLVVASGFLFFILKKTKQQD